MIIYCDTVHCGKDGNAGLSSVVVLEESPCPQESLRTNLKVRVL